MTTRDQLSQPESLRPASEARRTITNAHTTPGIYVGNIMDLCQERRGVFKDYELHRHGPGRYAL